MNGWDARSFRLTLVRHGPVESAGRCIGQTDLAPLDSAGASAERILQALDHTQPRPDSVWSSPLQRCLQPASLIARTLGIPLQVDGRLLEISQGAWEGRTWEEIERDFPEAFARYMANWQSEAPPAGETPSIFAGRVQQWYESLPTTHHTLVVAHAGVMRGLWALASATEHGTPWVDALTLRLPWYAAMYATKVAQSPRLRIALAEGAD